MAWVTIAQGTSLEEFQASRPPIADLPKGTKLLLRVELPWWAPIGWLADLYGMEWWMGLFAPEGITVDDVYGGWHWMEMKATVDPPLLPAILIILICTALSIIGVAAIIALVTLKAEIPGMVKWGAAAIIALAIAIALGYLLPRKKEAAPT